MGKNQLPAVNKPNEEFQLDFIGPITEKNGRFQILFSFWTGIVNGQPQAFVKQLTVKRRSDFWNNL